MKNAKDKIGNHLLAMKKDEAEFNKLCEKISFHNNRLEKIIKKIELSFLQPKLVW